ncbi:MAG: phage gp6-like head-tail connector protein [Gammaproteobacteria bacterium]|nr:phage gp6-like head-tail connector protein [Gammaproteobacteria bacterium]
MVALIETADEMVDDYASGAPATIRDHAVRMLVGYLYNDRGYAERRPRWGANAMRNSGAASLLAPYRVAQALVAG